MMDDRQLPTEEQRRKLCELIHHAFVELRHLYGWGSWSIAGTRARLLQYQQKHAAEPGVDYVALFDEIFGTGSQESPPAPEA